MSIVLPSSVNYRESLPSLPEGCQQINVACSPVNNQSFNPGDQIIFDFLNRGFLIPDSIYISYRWTATLTSTTNTPQLIGCPVYTPFNRLDLQIGSQTVDSMQNYNVMMNMLSNLTLSVSDKYGLQSAFGYNKNDGTNAVPSLEELDGRTIITGAGNLTGSFSGPLMSLLSNSEKLIPLFAMPQVRLILTHESLSTMFRQSGTNIVSPASWTLSNVELRYKIVDMGGNVEEMVRGMGDKIYIKSQSFASSTNTLTADSTGSNELIYNMRFASVKSIFAINGSSSNNSNGRFDSVDLTSNNGEYSFLVGGIQYPQKPLSALTNKAGILQELRSAIGSVYDKNNSFAINTLEFNQISTLPGATNNINCPAKCYIGCSVEKLNSNSLLTGISTQNSPISYRVTTGTAIGTANAIITLCVNYDALIEVDLVNRQCSVKT
jgi:hypothetical protein